jgi:hypothetical protein
LSNILLDKYITYGRSQGLETEAVAVEDIYSEFGFGEATPRAVHDFVAHAYHRWSPPSPRYVLLLGDATYDFKNLLGTDVVNRVPPLSVETSYLWTASDPTDAAVNREESLPDLAIGRLPARTVDEALRPVAKIVAFETGDGASESTLVLVADNTDDGGNFEANAEALASRVLAGRPVRKIYLGRLGGTSARQEIVQALDDGASLVSCVGHGSIHMCRWVSLYSADLERCR